MLFILRFKVKSCLTLCRPIIGNELAAEITQQSEMLSFHIKGIVHFEIKIWYLSAYPKGIQDVGVFFSSVDPILMFLGQTVLVCQSYNSRYR